jgi:NRAMP (natural resistance-associated macrophage protein)-like metal ion transporter
MTLAARHRAGPGAREFALRGLSAPVFRALRILGPGLITGASDDDPSGVATYAVAGASLGFATLWTTLITVPMMVTVQLISAKIGLVTGTGIVGVLRRHYPRPILYAVVAGLTITNTINAGVDIGAIAAATNIFVRFPVDLLIVPIGLVIVVLQVWGSYRLLDNVLRTLTLVFLAYVGAAFIARPDAAAVLRGTFVPTINTKASYIATLVALFGTSVSPYMWFWQARQEVEERIAIGERRLWQRRGVSARELRYATWDVNVGMIFSNAVAYFIILATGATLFKAGKTDLQSVAQAAEALRPLAGGAASLLFALGLAASGFLAVPVLTTSAAYAVAEAFGWRAGLTEKPKRAKAFYGVITASVLIGVLVNYAGINPIRALFLTAVITGFLTPPLLAVVLMVANNKSIMGKRSNSRLLNALGWSTTLIMTAAAVGLVLTWGS